MLCRKSFVKSKAGSVPVHLNVYDLTSMNGYAYWLGLGVYHSGVQGQFPTIFYNSQFINFVSSFFIWNHKPDLHIKLLNKIPKRKKKIPRFKWPFVDEIWIWAVHGVEYAFGAHEYPTTGIFEGEPKQCDGFTFRKSILIGWTDMTPGAVRGLMEELAEKYRGDAYNLITKNCNHFCNDACIKLTSNPIPNWVNRLARIG